MKKESDGLYTVPCEVNGLKLRFILDTGASFVSISLTEATFMLKNGYLNDSDITGTANIQTADGNIAENYVINLDEIKIGNIILRDIPAVVSSGLDAPLLLGQSVLDQLGSWTIRDNKLILNDHSGNVNSIETWEELEGLLEGSKNDKDRALSELEDLIDNNNEYASYLYLTYVLEPNTKYVEDKISKYIKKSFEILENYEGIPQNDVFLNYRKMIWFSLYRLKDESLANLYIDIIEDVNILEKDQYDILWDDFILASGWRLNSNIDPEIGNKLYDKGYYNAFETYCTYLKENKNDKTKAFQGYQKAASKGNLKSKYKLGLCYLEAEGTPKNITLGLKNLEEAAKLGHIPAISHLCYMYYYGNNVEQDYDKVIQYAKLYGNGRKEDKLRKAFSGLAYFGKKDYKFAFQELNDLDIMGLNNIDNNIMSQKNTGIYNAGINYIYDDILASLGEIYEKGLGHTVDFDKAYQYYTELSAYNPKWGYGMLGDMFFLNELIQENPQRAYQYYLLGANNNDGYCCFRLALMNYYGVGTNENEIKAQEYKEKAIKLGFKESDFKF